MTSSNSLVQQIRICWWAVLKLDENPSRPNGAWPGGFSSNFRTAHQQMRICCTSELEEVIVVGEVACTRSRDALSVTPRAGGKAAQFAGHRMTVYRKLRDGRWLLSRDVHTLSAMA